MIGQLDRGGAELQLARVLEHLNRPPWRHTVMQFVDGGDEEILRAVNRLACARVELHKRKPVDLRFIVRFIRELRQARPDIVHTWLSGASLWGRLLAGPALGRVPLVTSVRAHLTYTFPGALTMERRLARRTDAYIFNARRLTQTWTAKLGNVRCKLITVPNGVDDEKFHPRPKDPAARAALGCPAGAVLVTMVGSLYPVKNWPMFLDIAQRVRQAGRSAYFLGVGGGELLDRMRHRAAAEGLSPSTVNFLGNRTDVAEICGISDIALFTSDSEGMPNAVLEAMASGLPVVSTNVSGADELIVDDRNGYLVPIGDAAAGAERIIRLCDDANLRRRMGEESRRQVRAPYTFAAMAEGHEAAYREALARHGKLTRS